MKAKLSEIETNSNNKNITDLYIGIKEFKKGHQAKLNKIKNEIRNCLRILISSPIDGKAISVNY